MRVDESIFSVLYTEGQGAPNASIRVLVGMMILKEGQGWSDEQLFENREYNLLIRSVLGLMSLEDAEPVGNASTQRFRRLYFSSQMIIGNMGKTAITYLIDEDPKGTQYAIKICQVYVVPRSNLSNKRDECSY